MGTKARIALLVLFLFGVPAIVTTALLSSSTKDLTADGPQPGGALQGEVHDAAGAALAATEIEVFTIAGEGAPVRVAAAKSDERGAFEISIPPIQGHYELHASRADWQEHHRDLTLLDNAGKPVSPAPIRIVLLPAARLDIEFVHANGSAAGAGSFELSGVETGGFFASFNSRHVQSSGTFEAGTLSILGLPPMQVHLAARFISGERVELVLQLVPGKNHHRVEL